MYDFTTGTFAWSNNWYADILMHQWMKLVFISMGLVTAASLLLNHVFSLGWFSVDVRRKLYIILCSAALVPLSVSLMKMLSVHSCPWDLIRYGGVAPYLRIFDTLPPGFAAGHCFPAGHASSALWLPAFAVFWLPARPRTAAAIFAAALTPGLVLGYIQQMRGAHFLTHTLWSVWIASFVIVFLVRVLYSPPQNKENCIPCNTSDGNNRVTTTTVDQKS
jgi:membrane-associated PAP2 superfamily phosphatase